MNIRSSKIEDILRIIKILENYKITIRTPERWDCLDLDALEYLDNYIMEREIIFNLWPEIKDGNIWFTIQGGYLSYSIDISGDVLRECNLRAPVIIPAPRFSL